MFISRFWENWLLYNYTLLWHHLDTICFRSVLTSNLRRRCLVMEKSMMQQTWPEAPATHTWTKIADNHFRVIFVVSTRNIPWYFSEPFCFKSQQATEYLTCMLGLKRHDYLASISALQLEAQACQQLCAVDCIFPFLLKTECGGFSIYNPFDEWW